MHKLKGHLPSIYKPPDSVIMFLSMILGISMFCCLQFINTLGNGEIALREKIIAFQWIILWANESNHFMTTLSRGFNCS